MGSISGLIGFNNVNDVLESKPCWELSERAVVSFNFKSKIKDCISRSPNTYIHGSSQF